MNIGPFATASVIVSVAAIAAYMNHITLRLPQTIALTLTGATVSLLAAIADRVWPAIGMGRVVQSFMATIDFRSTLLNVMLSFLLFAGALHVDLRRLRTGKWPILMLSTLGVLISTLVVGGGFWLLTKGFGATVPFGWCLVFGALISPTDPVAVIAILQKSAAPNLLKTTVAAESLFNDGVGIVLFVVLLSLAAGGGALSPLQGLEMFLLEALGGVGLGLLLGLIGFLTIRSVEDYATEALITLALVMGGYSLAAPLGFSGPVAMAVAGLIIGNVAMPKAMSAVTQDHMTKFWDLLDQLLNAALFLLIGLQGVALIGAPGLFGIGLLTIPLTLVARMVSIAPALLIWRRLLPFRQAFPILTWGGLRGGICVAMALSLPETPTRGVILVATYTVVMFSVLVQGTSVQPLIRRIALRSRGR